MSEVTKAEAEWISVLAQTHALWRFRNLPLIGDLVTTLIAMACKARLQRLRALRQMQ